MQLACEHSTNVCMGTPSGLNLNFSLPRSQGASLAYDTERFGMHILLDPM